MWMVDTITFPDGDVYWVYFKLYKNVRCGGFCPRISKIQVQHKGTVVYEYDRGESIEPATVRAEIVADRITERAMRGGYDNIFNEV